MPIINKQKSASYLEGIIKYANDGILLVDADGRITRSNPSFTKILGYEEAEIIGKRFTDIVHKQAKVKRITTPSKIHHFLRSGETPMEMKLISKDGIPVPVSFRATLIKNDQGEVVEAIGIIDDLREHRGGTVIEQKIWETEETLHNVLANSGDAIIVVDANSQINIANDALLTMLGFEENEIVGRHLLELSPFEGTYSSVSGEEFTFTDEYLNQQAEKANELFEKGKVANYEIYMTRKDGKIIPIEATISVLKNQEGERRGSIAICRDITERKKAEKEIREAKEFLEKIIESSKDGIIITDEKGMMVSVNTAVEQMFGFEKDELIGKHTSVLVIDDKDTKNQILEKIGELFEKGYVSYEAVYRRKDGQCIDVECNSSVIKDNQGNAIGGVSIIRNISERKIMEKQLLQSEKLRSLGELAGGVAHDFNNVLAAILGRAQLLRMNVKARMDNGERRKSVLELNKGLEVIEKAARDGAETVRRIQEFSRRRDDDKFFAQIDIHEILENALEFTRTIWKDDAEPKGIKFNIKREFHSVPSTVGSASELREVFTNLIKNAIDAMPQGGDINLKTYQKDGYIAVQVKDTGVGLEPSIRERIFDPFFTTKGPQSSGLGMSVSYGIIHRHRGTIEVDSIQGKGTTFTIKIPISQKITGEELVKPAPERRGKARVLVIEDEDDVRSILSDILTDGGHEVETASDGMQGLELFAKKDFDLVFTDLGMPGMSGWQVAEKVKRINRNVPVALITGWNIEPKESEMKSSGVDLIVYKPFEVNQVLKLVQEGMHLRDRFQAA